MARIGEHSYYERIGPEGRAQALGKPFSLPDRGWAMMEAGAVLSLLPPPPARVLESGCGTGWLASILARCGYDVVGQDISEHAIELARANVVFASGPRPLFLAGDFETLGFREEFDAVVFYDALHHATDEEGALRSAYEALRPGGVAVVSEPGIRHAHTSKEVAETFQVTDKDMPPHKVIRLARRIGFRHWRVYPHGAALGRAVFAPSASSWTRTLRRYALLLFSLLVRRANGITVLVK